MRIKPTEKKGIFASWTAGAKLGGIFLLLIVGFMLYAGLRPMTQAERDARALRHKETNQVLYKQMQEVNRRAIGYYDN